MKALFIFLVSVASSLAYSQQVRLTDFLRDSHQMPLTNLSPSQAMIACSKNQSRLPTVFDLAQAAAEKGAVLLKVSEYNEGQIPAECRKEPMQFILSRELDGRLEAFYYCKGRYKTTLEESGLYQILSASFNLNGDRVWTMNSRTGYIKESDYIPAQAETSLKLIGVFKSLSGHSARCVETQAGVR